MKELDSLEEALHPAINAERAVQIAEQAIALGRKLSVELNANVLLLQRERDDHLLELEKLMRTLCDARLERYKLKTYLRQAIRAWMLNTPNVEDAVTAFRMAREAELVQ